MKLNLERNSVTLRIVSANIQHGLANSPIVKEENRSSVQFLAAAGNELADLQADLVCLQEVDNYHLRSGNVNQTRILATFMGAKFWCFAPATGGAIPGRGQTPQVLRPVGSPGYGEAILSNLPVARWVSYPLGRRRWGLGPKLGESKMEAAFRLARIARAQLDQAREEGVSRFKKLLRFSLPEARQALCAHVQTPFGMVQVVSTHLSLERGTSRRQLGLLWSTLNRGMPVVLTGDLNRRGGEIENCLGDPRAQIVEGLKTYPLEDPSLDLDHVIGSNQVELRNVRTHRLIIGDHLALISDVEIFFPVQNGEVSDEDEHQVLADYHARQPSSRVFVKAATAVKTKVKSAAQTRSFGKEFTECNELLSDGAEQAELAATLSVEPSRKTKKSATKTRNFADFKPAQRAISLFSNRRGNRLSGVVLPGSTPNEAGASAPRLFQLET